MPKELIVPFKIKMYMGSQSVAELIVNANLEELFTNTKGSGVHVLDGKWYIRDYGRGIQISHFLEKENFAEDEPIGVDYPINMGLVNAIAYLTTHFVEIIIFSKYNTFTFETVNFNFKDDTGNLKIIYSEPFDPNFIGTYIEINGAKDNNMVYCQYESAKYWKDTDIEKTDYGMILRKPTYNGAVFVNGIKVSPIHKLPLVLNVYSNSKVLKNAIKWNRFTVPKALFLDDLKKLLLSITSVKIAKEILNHNYVKTENNFFDEKTWNEIYIHCIKILNSTGAFVFLSETDTEYQLRFIRYAHELELQVIFIKDSLIQTIYGMCDYNEFPILIKDELYWKYITFSRNIVKYKELTKHEQKIYSNFKVIFQLFGERPSELKKIFIFENHDNDQNISGLRMCFWNYSESSLNINRLTLQSKKIFATIIIPELIQIKYGSMQLTEEYESKILELIGHICLKAR